jgi:hypothetical protein
MFFLPILSPTKPGKSISETNAFAIKIANATPSGYAPNKRINTVTPAKTSA